MADLAGWRGAWRESLGRRLAAAAVDDAELDRDKDVTRVYVATLLTLLERLQTACSLKDAGGDRYNLGMRDLMVVRASLEAVVLFGVYPALPAGLGMPAHRRSPHYALLEGAFFKVKALR